MSRSFAVLALALLAAGCDDHLFNQGKDDTAPAGDGFCGVRSIFSSQCTSCHGPSGSAGLDLETDPHAAVVDRPSTTVPGAILVAPGDPDGSLLYRKSAGTQGGDEGGSMPMGSTLGTADLDTLRAWIADGATEACDQPDDTAGSDGFHPDGWDASTVHGLAAKTRTLDCTDCHGADLTGATGPSCDTCHPADWRTDCTFCHGGVDNTLGAPPEGIRDETSASALSFPPHTAHVEADWTTPIDCVACHRKPTEVLSFGHLFVDDSTLGVADVTFAGGLSAGGTWSGGSCSNLYCHGNGQGANGRVSATAGAMACGSCHAGVSSGEAAWDGMSGEHGDHLEEGETCADCHGATTTDDRTIANAALHVDGDPDLTLPSTITRTGDTCNGSCHGVSHSGRDWN